LAMLTAYAQPSEPGTIAEPVREAAREALRLRAVLDAHEPATENDTPRTTVAEAIAAWEANGPTSLTVALVVDALYGVRDVCDHVEADR